MKRVMLQVYVKDSKLAVSKYIEAFNGEIISQYLNETGGYYHCEIKIEDMILAISEADNVRLTDDLSVMQFCLHYNESEQNKIKQAFNTLKVESCIHYPLGASDYASLMVDFTDQFGVRWCLFG